MNADILLEAVDLHAEYHRNRGVVPVLRGASLALRRGEPTAVVGRSGSGKSTLLAMLSGQHVPSRGRVVVDGVELGPLSEGQRAQMRLRMFGWVFQDFRLLPTLTAEENVALVARLQGASRRDALARARSTLERVGLDGRGTHRPAELSGGEQQRVGLARAVVNRPEIVLADEPTASVDTELRDSIADLLLEITADSALLIVTHDPELAARAARRLRLEDGALHSVP